MLEEIKEKQWAPGKNAKKSLVAEILDLFLELKHKTVNAALGSQLGASLQKKLSLKMMYQKITVVSMLEELKKVITLKKLAVDTLVQTPLETATTSTTLKVQDTKSWPNTSLTNHFGLKTSPLLGNLLPPMVTLV